MLRKGEKITVRQPVSPEQVALRQAAVFGAVGAAKFLWQKLPYAEECTEGGGINGGVLQGRPPTTATFRVTSVRKVLLIDDDPVVTSLYGKMLREQGFDVEIAGDGEEGLQAVRRRMPDVVLLDLDMPRVSGISWLKTIRSRVRSKNLPVVILTAGRNRKQLRAAKHSDAVFVLAKETVRPHIVVEALTAAASTNGSVKVWT